MEDDNLVRLQFNYRHTNGSAFEQISRLEVHSDTLPLKDGDVHGLVKKYSLGHLLSKIMQCVLIMKSGPPLEQLSVDDFEALINLLKNKYFHNPEDRIFFDAFLADSLWPLFFEQGYRLWPFLQDLYFFAELCSTESKFCTTQNIAIINSRFMEPSSVEKRLIREDSTPGIYSKPLSLEEIRSLLEGESSPATYDYKVNNLAQMCSASLHEIFGEGHIIKRCSNCNQFFVPLNRSDTLYCNEPAPQDQSKSCREYGKYMTYLKKTQIDEATKLYKQIYNAKMNRVKRCEDKRYSEDLNAFITEARKWKADIKTGVVEEDAYVRWLKDMKGKKV